MLGRQRIERGPHNLMGVVTDTPHHIRVVLPLNHGGVGQGGDVFADHEGVIIGFLELNGLRFRRVRDQSSNQLFIVLRHGMLRSISGSNNSPPRTYEANTSQIKFWRNSNDFQQSGPEMTVTEQIPGK